MVGEGTCGTRVTPVTGMLCEAGEAKAGLLGELEGSEEVGVTPGEEAVVAAGISYFCSCSR